MAMLRHKAVGVTTMLTPSEW